jgi:hypothetical protein
MAVSIDWEAQRLAWPGLEHLRPRELSVHVAWHSMSSVTRLRELAKCVGWVHPGPPYTQVEQCRDLTLSGRSLPVVSTRRQPEPLSPAELIALTQGISNVWQGNTSSSQISSDDFDELRAQLLAQQAEISQLRSNMDADPDEAKSTYQVGFSSLALLPGEGAGSWHEVPILAKRDRQRLLREHTGTFGDFPKDLELKEVFGDYPAVKALKITFNAFVKEDMQRALTMNRGTLQSILTVHSKLDELNTELLSLSLNSDETTIDESATVNARDVREKVCLLLENVVGASKLALDAHAGLRLSVSNKVMQSIGAKHLSKTSTDKDKDDFISKDVAEKIMERAELKEGVRIATNATKGVFGTPTPKSWGNGNAKKGRRLSKGFSTPTQPSKRPGKGSGKGGGKGRGGGRGKWKGDSGRGSGSGSDSSGSIPSSS